MTHEQVAPHMARFLHMLDGMFRRYGASDGAAEPAAGCRGRDAPAPVRPPLPASAARYGAGGEAAPLRDRDVDPEGTLADIYSDAVMQHVDAAGETLPSTNSQPSYVLWLLHLLDLQPGQRVLEIGSGSGWLAAVIARLVGEAGQVTGIEIIPELAEQSRADLAGLGLGTVTVTATDGAAGFPAGAPFDRVMITAATWALPAVLFRQVAEGGLVLAPVELRGGGCQVSVLRRGGAGFVAQHAVAGWFVPLLGPGQDRPALRLTLADSPFWDEVGVLPSQRTKLPLGTGPDGVGGAVMAFRAFLGRVAPGFTIFGSGEPPEQRPWLPAEPFGIADAARRSVALWRSGELLGYGDPSALQAVLRAYADWTSCGMPGLAGFGLHIVRSAAATAGRTPGVGGDARRDSAGLAAAARGGGLAGPPGIRPRQNEGSARKMGGGKRSGGQAPQPSSLQGAPAPRRSSPTPHIGSAQAAWIATPRRGGSR